MSHIKWVRAYTPLLLLLRVIGDFSISPPPSSFFLSSPYQYLYLSGKALSFSSLVFSHCSALSLFLFTARSYLLSCSNILLHPLFPRIFQHSLSISFHTLTLNSARVREIWNLDRETDRKHVSSRDTPNKAPAVHTLKIFVQRTLPNKLYADTCCIFEKKPI